MAGSCEMLMSRIGANIRERTSKEPLKRYLSDISATNARLGAL